MPKVAKVGAFRAAAAAAAGATTTRTRTRTRLSPFTTDSTKSERKARTVKLVQPGDKTPVVVGGTSLRVDDKEKISVTDAAALLLRRWPGVASSGDGTDGCDDGDGDGNDFLEFLNRTTSLSKIPKTTAAAAVTATDTAAVAPSSSEGPPLSRGQRKRLAKKEQYLRRERMVRSVLRLKEEEKEQRNQRKRLDGLDAIRKALRPIVAEVEVGAGADDGAPSLIKSKPTTMTTTTSSSLSTLNTSPSVATAPAVGTTNRSKKDLTAKETARMGLVLSHPAFESDPFETMRLHLRNTFVTEAKARLEASDARRVEDERLAKERKEAKKEMLKSVVSVRTKAKKGKRAVARGGGKSRSGGGVVVSRAKGRRDKR